MISSAADERAGRTDAEPRPLEKRVAAPRKALRYRDFLTVVLIAQGSQVASTTTGSTFTIRASRWAASRTSNLVAGDGARSDHDLLRPGILLLRGRRPVDTPRRGPDRAWQARAAARSAWPTPADVVDGCVVRQPKAYPVYDDDYSRNVDSVRDELEQQVSDLHLVGRNGMHKYNNQDHAMMTAMLCARTSRRAKALRPLGSQPGRRIPRSGAAGEEQAASGVRLVPMPLHRPTKPAKARAAAAR